MKRHSYIKKLLNSNAGFTLLEVICVVAILGMLAAMVVPASVKMQRTAKISATQARLDEVKAAVIGSLGAYDAQGKPVAGGFAGDTGRLPYLFAARWEAGQWDWVYDDGEGTLEAAVNDGTGQPVELWREIPEDYASPEWAGPYLAVPRDPYPDDTKNISYETDPEIFTAKQVEGRLSDAWGRMLYFWLEYPLVPDPAGGESARDTENKTGAVLWLISAGPDGRAVFAGEEYDGAAAENKDNIIVKIMPREWYWENSDLKTAGTREILGKIRDAVVTRESGLLLSGYIGDMGAWPGLYASWDETAGAWEPAAAVLIEDPEDPLYAEEYDTDVTTGSPRGLWAKPGDGTDPDLWKGPYLDPPWGTGENQLLEDDWGKPLRFRLITVMTKEEVPAVLSEYLEITSGGMDMTIGSADDISIIIHDYEWQEDGRDRNTLAKIALAQSLLNAVRAAFLGDGAARNAAGRVIISGYLADTGALPEIEADPQTGIRETTLPHWLWDNPYGEGPAPAGFSWRGAYYPETETGEIDDPWGNPLHFVIEAINEDDFLHIISAGPDRRMDEDDEDEIDYDADNVSVIIGPRDWQAESFTISGTLINPAPVTAVTTVVGEPDPNDPGNTLTVTHEPDLGDLTPWEVTFKLYTEPGAEPILFDPVPVSRLEGTRSFALDVPRCLCGVRLLTVEQSGSGTGGGTTVIARISLQIGAGGTHSPAADRLIIYIDPFAESDGR